MDQAAPVNEQPPQFHAITPAGGPVGKPFEGGNPDSWPGVSGDASKNGNHYSYSKEVVDPPVSTVNQQVGGKKRRTRKRHHKKAKKAKKSRRGRKSMSKRRKTRGKKRSGKRKHLGKRKSRGKKRGRRATRKMRGGSSRDLIGMPIRNGGRAAIFGVQELVNNWNGRPTPISADPNPTNQPLSGSAPFERTYVDLNALGSSADNAVANM